jgi:hypothetical protein
MGRQYHDRDLARPAAGEPTRGPDGRPTFELPRCERCGSARLRVTGTRQLGGDGLLRYLACVDCHHTFAARFF